MYALDLNGVKRRPASTGDRATCPSCGCSMIAHVGEIYCHHWAHEKNDDCDAWAQESSWHQEWKSHALPERTEVVIERNGKRHRADIQFLSDDVVELQHGTLSPSDIRAREEFYVRGLWLYDGSSIGFSEDRVHWGRNGGFWWKNGPQRLAHHRWPIWLDLGPVIVRVSINVVWNRKSEGRRVVGKPLQQSNRVDFQQFIASNTGAAWRPVQNDE